VGGFTRRRRATATSKFEKNGGSPFSGIGRDGIFTTRGGILSFEAEIFAEAGKKFRVVLGKIGDIFGSELAFGVGENGFHRFGISERSGSRGRRRINPKKNITTADFLDAAEGDDGNGTDCGNLGPTTDKRGIFHGRNGTTR
jgi:hypothetical protein